MRGLPLLAVFAAFLLFGAELWEVEAKMSALHFAGLLGLVLGLTTAFVLISSLNEIRERASFADWDELASAARGPAGCTQPDDDAVEDVLARIERGTPPAPDALRLQLRGRRRINALGVLGVYQALILVPVLVGSALLFYALAWLAVPLEVAANWVYGDGAGAAEERRIATSAFLEQPWARTAILLAVFSLLYVVVTVFSDAQLRKSFFSGADDGLRQRFAAAVAYRLAYYPDGECLAPSLGERLRGRLAAR